jgi:hypothetical protein
MNIVKLVYILLKRSEWKLERYQEIKRYRHISGVYTYVGSIYFHKTRYEYSDIIFPVMNILFSSMRKYVESRLVA